MHSRIFRARGLKIGISLGFVVPVATVGTKIGCQPELEPLCSIVPSHYRSFCCYPPPSASSTALFSITMFLDIHPSPSYSIVTTGLIDCLYLYPGRLRGCRSNPFGCLYQCYRARAWPAHAKGKVEPGSPGTHAAASGRPGSQGAMICVANDIISMY